MVWRIAFHFVKLQLLRAVKDSSRDMLGGRMECPYATHNSYDERKTLGGLSRLVKPKVKGLTQHFSDPECAADLERVVATRKMRLMINS